MKKLWVKGESIRALEKSYPDSGGKGARHPIIRWPEWPGLGVILLNECLKALERRIVVDAHVHCGVVQQKKYQMKASFCRGAC